MIFSLKILIMLRLVINICKNIDRSIFEVSVIGVSSQQNMLTNFHQNKIYCA